MSDDGKKPNGDSEQVHVELHVHTPSHGVPVQEIPQLEPTGRVACAPPADDKPEIVDARSADPSGLLRRVARFMTDWKAIVTYVLLVSGGSAVAAAKFFSRTYEVRLGTLEQDDAANKVAVPDLKKDDDDLRTEIKASHDDLQMQIRNDHDDLQQQIKLVLDAVRTSKP